MLRHVSARGRRCAAAGTLGLLLALGGAAGRAEADMMSDDEMLEQTTMVVAQQSNVYSIMAPAAGTLVLHVEDIIWPSALQSLTLSVNSPTSVLGAMSGGGELDLTVPQAGRYYIDVAGQAAGSLGIGLYSLDVTFQAQPPAVPLPTTLVLLLSGLVLLGTTGLWLRNESVMYAT